MPAPAVTGPVRIALRVAGVTMAALAAAAAVISYMDGLFLVRLAGAGGGVAYLYPALPDGIIVISAEAIYVAAQIGQPRPRWATTGVGLGAVLTLGMNAAAGARLVVPLALVDGIVPMVFFVALEILVWLVRRGRAPVVAAPGPATSSQDEPPEPPTPLEALSVLLASDSQRRLAGLLGVPRSRVAAWADRVAPAAEVAKKYPSDDLAEPSLNGQAASD